LGAVGAVRIGTAKCSGVAVFLDVYFIDWVATWAQFNGKFRFAASEI